MSRYSAARGIIGGIFAGLLVVWTGLSLYFKTSGILTWGEWGMYYTLGLAVIFLLQGIAWLFIPGMRKDFIGMLIPAMFLAVTGLIPLVGGGWYAWESWWPFMIVAVGLVIIVSTVWGIASRHKKKKVEE
ncbi:hypothetical protein JXM67_03790 [candidate division WOR-3 bacterium]|nr:hypothetical protein [candidate division WOR-3 bacterium]